MSLDYLKEIGKAKDAVKTIADTALGKVAAEFADSTLATMKDKVPTSQGDTGNLKQSLAFQFKSEGTVLSIEFLADDYWDFVNSGVDGVSQSAGATTNQYGTTYSFKTPNPSRKMVDSIMGKGSMQNWLAAKGITSLTYGGKTHSLQSDADYRGAAYVIARAVKRHGIKPSHFVDDSLTEEKLQAFEQALLDAFEEMI